MRGNPDLPSRVDRLYMPPPRPMTGCVSLDSVQAELQLSVSGPFFVTPQHLRKVGELINAALEPNRTLADDLDDLLNHLPPDVAGMAMMLLDKGIRGVPSSRCACPIARWLREELDVPYAEVDHDQILIADHIGNEYRTVTPTVVHAFMERFDNFPYADLIDVKGLTDEELWVSH